MADGSIMYFEACLAQMRQGDLQLLVEGLLGIPWSSLHSYHVSRECTTWSWACLSKKRYRTLEEAARAAGAVTGLEDQLGSVDVNGH